QFALALIGGALISLSYVGACALVVGERPPRRTLMIAWWVAILIWIPVPFLALALFLPALAWLAFAGLAVPAAIMERREPRSALGRGVQLGRADYVHSLGSLAALVIVVTATSFLLTLLIHTGSHQAARVAKVSVALGARGSAKLQTFELIEIDDLLAQLSV